MSNEEYNRLMKKIEDRITENKNNPQKAKETLVHAGIITEKGNLRKPYKK